MNKLDKFIIGIPEYRLQNIDGNWKITMTNDYPLFTDTDNKIHISNKDNVFYHTDTDTMDEEIISEMEEIYIDAYHKTLSLYIANQEGVHLYQNDEFIKVSEVISESDSHNIIDVDNMAYPGYPTSYDNPFYNPKYLLLSIEEKLKIRQPLAKIFIKDPSTRIIAFCYIFNYYHLPLYQGYNINNIAVDPDYKGKNICQYMIKYALMYLLPNRKPITIGFEHLQTKKYQFNIASCRCYLKNGFRLINSRSVLGQEILAYNTPIKDNVIEYIKEYKTETYNLIETQKYKTLMLVHKDSVNEYDINSINQYYDINESIVCIKKNV